MIKAFDKWLLSYLTRDRSLERQPPKHIVIALCDHFEPFHQTDNAGALERIRRWHKEWKHITGMFADSDGQPPKHSFFFPIEQYDRETVARIGEICHATRSEGGIHLHHSDDNPSTLEEALLEGKDRLQEHGLIGSDGRYPFIHGDWALDNSHPEGKHCGVSGELSVLRRTGCYADFTLPSAPNPAQTRTINSIYYVRSTEQPKSHDVGDPAGRITRKLRNDPTRLLMVQGPLGLNWRWRKLGIIPRVENGDVTGANPPTMSRLALWNRIAPRLPERPDTVFIKLHTHGAIEQNSQAILGEPMKHFHRELAESEVNFHYTTAREMVNIIHAYEDGKTGSPGDYRDHQFGR